MKILFTCVVCTFASIAHASQCSMGSLTDSQMYLASYYHSQAATAFNIKCDKSYKRLRRKGLKNVQLEFLLVACGYNLYKYHNKVIFASITLKYKFNVEGVKGDCIIKINFPEFISKRDITSEVQYVVNFNINKECKGIASENDLRKKVVSYIDTHKLKSFQSFKN